MQTLSPTISPAIAKTITPRVSASEAASLSAIADSSVLQTALAGLDASLNDELDRYRHWLENGQTISYLNPFRPRAVSTQSIWTSPSLSDALSPIAPISETNSDRRTIQMPIMPPMATTTSPAINIASAELHQYKGLDSIDNFENPSFNEYADDGMGINSSTMATGQDDDEILQSFANDYADSYQESVDADNQIPIPSAPPEKVHYAA